MMMTTSNDGRGSVVLVPGDEAAGVVVELALLLVQ
jgi:hypothetical protein